MQPASLAGRGVAQRHAARKRRSQKVGIGGRRALLAVGKALGQRKRADLALDGLEPRRRPIHACVPERLSAPNDVRRRLARHVPVKQLPHELGLAASRHGNRHARVSREPRNASVDQLLRAAGVERELAAQLGVRGILGALHASSGLNRHIGGTTAAAGHADHNTGAGGNQRGPTSDERPSRQLYLRKLGKPASRHARSPSSSVRIWAMTCCAPCSRLLGMTRCAICLTP